MCLTASSPYLSPQSSLRQENVTVFGCLTHEVPLSLGDAAVTCSKGGVRRGKGGEAWNPCRTELWGVVWRKDRVGSGGRRGRWVRVFGS
jgi:hypothetical protein